MLRKLQLLLILSSYTHGIQKDLQNLSIRFISMESEEHIKNIEDLRESSIENNEDKGKNQEPGAYVINININVYKRFIY